MWHTKPFPELFTDLGSSPNGLDNSQAARLRELHGPNELRAANRRPAWRLLLEQFTATMVLILAAAGVAALAMGDRLEAIAIFAIVVLFGLLGFLQEYRAEKSLAALKRLSVPSVRVRRQGQTRLLPAVDLVPGDLLILESGNIVPADCRLVECHGLKAQESALTGESEAVEKQTGALSDPDAPLGDRVNMVWLGTQVVHGRGEALVVATGMATELGKIARLIQDVETTASPLQRRLEGLGRILAICGLVIAAVVAGLGVLAGESLPRMLILGISLAVAIIPEGLPAVLTITLALGAGRMLARHALIRKLPAVETLGAVTVICSDKTGTLTQNRMTVAELACPAGPAAIELLSCLCNDAKAAPAPSPDDLSPDAHSPPAAAWLGDPTETCLLDLAVRAGHRPEALAAACPRLAELAFDPVRKRMATLHRRPGPDSHPPLPELPPSLAAAWDSLAGPGSDLLAVKGSVDGLLAVCTRRLGADGLAALDADGRAEIEASLAALADRGMRVLGFAAKAMPRQGGPGPAAPSYPAAGPAALEPGDESGLVFVGLVGIIDPPRPEVRAAVATCLAAGIRPVMITGDHPLTALAIARELGMGGSGTVITGRQLEAMDDETLRRAVNDCQVFARVSPEHKLRIVGAFQFHRQVVAMTGDGVNDAPALRKADIGVAMGITGTDVAKEASLMVLTDDNFASIVAAVEEGRVIYDNVRKYLKFSLGGNLGKVAVLLLLPLASGLLAGAGLAPGASAPLMVGLSAIQLLWLNLLCDGLLSVGLGVEHAETGVMLRRPVKPQAGILNAELNAYVLVNGVVMGMVSLGAGLAWWLRGADPAMVRTVIFMTLFFLQMWAVLSVRTGLRPIIGSAMPPNRTVLLMVALSFALQMAGMYLPALADFLSVRPLPPGDLAGLLAISLVMLPVLEAQKAIQRRFLIPRSG